MPFYSVYLEENNNSLNFLDMTVVRTGNTFRCKWFQKATASGRYLNHLSVQPHIYKQSVVSNLAHRIVSLTDKYFLTEVMQQGKDLLFQNCYPPALVHKVFNRVLENSRKNRNNNSVLVPAKPAIDSSKIISLPYVPWLSENLASMLQLYSFKVVHSIFNNLSFLWSSLKSKRDTLQESCVVYKINCKDCEVGYIGQTKQQLGKRINGHKYDKKEVTALHQHQTNLNHNFDFENAKVLARESNDFTRTLLEMVFIIKHRASVCNYRADVEKLGVAYHQFFQGAGWPMSPVRLVIDVGTLTSLLCLFWF